MNQHRTPVARYCVNIAGTMQDVMTCIDRNTKGIALVVDDDQRLIATLTDGDLRRAILHNYGIEAPILKLVAAKKGSAYPKPVTGRWDITAEEGTQLMQSAQVRHLPLLDRSGTVVGLMLLDELIQRSTLPVQAVVMAGGFGTRLHPLTYSVPKPMLPVGDRPILERIVGRLAKVGIENVNITTHYMPEQIKEHFGNGHRFGVKINYVDETTPLGTAGALGLMEAPDAPLLIMNADILTEIDFRAMVEFHQENHADVTVAARQYEYKVPYGVLECEGPEVIDLQEKPTYKFLVNAGIYLVQPSVHRMIPANQRFDMTDLVEKVLGTGGKVVSFPIVEYWLDIGQHEDYQQAITDVEKGRVSV